MQAGWQRLTEAFCDFCVETQRPLNKNRHDWTGLFCVDLRETGRPEATFLQHFLSMHLLQGPLVLVFCSLGTDPDFTNMFLIPEKGHVHSCDTSQVCWAARTRHTTFPLSKAAGKASLHDLVRRGAATAGKSAGGRKAQGEGSPRTWRGWQVMASEEDRCGQLTLICCLQSGLGTLVFIPSFNPMSGKWASPVAQWVKNPAAMQETQVTQV